MALYRGWDLEDRKTAGDHAALQSDAYIPPSSFTPINKLPLPAPQSSVASPLVEQTEQPNRGKTRGRRHNPAVSQYLGLGVETEPPLLEKYAPTASATPRTPPRRRKRSRKKADGNSQAKDDTENTKAPTQARVSDGLRVTKPVSRKTVRKGHVVNTGPTHPNNHVSNPSAMFPDVMLNTPEATPHQVTKPPKVRKQSSKKPKVTSRGPLVADGDTTKVDSAPSADGVVLSLADQDSQDTLAEDGIDDLLQSIDLDNLTNSTTNIQPRTGSSLQKNRSLDSRHDRFESKAGDDLFLLAPDLTDDLSSPARALKIDLGSGKASLANSAESTGVTDGLPPTTIGRVQVSKDHQDVLYSDDGTSSRTSGRFISPVTPKTKALIQEGAASFIEDRKPIVRPPFPTPVRDRSPIIGLSSNLLLRTCFRIGEAINQACHAVKHGQNIIFELYARVLISRRDEAKQHFIFGDLFHEKPPHIKGVYEAAIWRQVELYNYDSGRLLEKQRMCRCIGTMKRDGKEWVMTVLNVWETTWEDIAWVEGIVNC